MKKGSKLGILTCLVVIAGLVGPSLVEAASTTRYFSFTPGSQQLWFWTITGKDRFGANVTTGTMPKDMADPAKVTLYYPGGGVEAEYRNYRPDYQDLNDWKIALPGVEPTTELVAVNLAGSSTGTNYTLQMWGEDSGTNVTAMSSPSAAPAYDNVGNAEFVWFGQTTASEPTWWCEDQTAAAAKGEPGPALSFIYTLDDIAIDAEEEVTFWIGGFVTNNLAGLETGSAAYGILEGNMQLKANLDEDGDGYYPLLNQADALYDCDDNDGDDPAICATCVCGDADCVPCARCIYKDAAGEVAGDGVDTNCNGQDDCFIATASFGTPMEGKIEALRDFRDSVLMNSHWGRVLVDTYYHLSPSVASYIDSHGAVKAAVRTALLPVVGATWVVNSHKGAVAALALGFVALGLVVRRKEKMRSVLVVLLAVGFIGMPVLASADVDALETALEEGKSCSEAVKALIEAGVPEAEVVKAALERSDKCSETEIITSAIQAGADPFTVAYVAKEANVDLANVVDPISDTPAPSAGPGAPVIVTGTGSTWGSSHYVASPSL